MKYISDDGKVTGTEAEVLAYEDVQKIEGEFAQQIREYLDAIVIEEKDENGQLKIRNLTSREFTRRETVIKDWLRWDRQRRPERYEKEEVDESAVRVVTGAA